VTHVFGRLGYPWVLAITLGFTETVSWGATYYAFGVFVEPMQAELGWTRAQTTGAFSIALVVLGIAGVGVGQWLDRRGPRLLMTAGSIATVVVMLLWSTTHDLVSFYVVWIAMGLSWSATLYSPAFAAVTAHFRERRTEALTVVTLMAGLASTIFIPLAAWLVGSLGWRSAIVALALILGVTTIVPHALVLRPAPEHDERHEPSASLGEALRHASFRWLAIGFFCSALGIGVNTHLVPYLSGRGYDLGTAAFIAGLVGAVQLVGRISFAPLERRLRPETLVAAIYALQPIALAVLLLFGGPVAPFVFVALFGAHRGADTLMRSTGLARLYGPRRFASIQGVLNLLLTIAWATGPVGLGALYDRTGGYELGFWLVAGASALGVVAMVLGTAAGSPASQRA
jgi:predicted MFS family arabinose efflux permease